MWSTDEISYELIPEGTIAKACFRIRAGGYNDESKGWTCGWATKSRNSEAVYLNGEFEIIEGPFRGKKIFHSIGLYSPKDASNESIGKVTFADVGKSFMSRLIHSIRGINPKDKSDEAKQKRAPHDPQEPFKDLHGGICLIQIGIKVSDSPDYDDKNVVQKVIMADHKQYQEMMDIAPSPTQRPIEGFDDDISF